MSALATAVVSETETLFTAPGINYYAIAPILIIFGAAVVSVLVEAFVPRRARRPVQLVLVIGSVLAALAVVIDLRGTRLITGEGALAIDGPTLIMQGTLLIIALLAAFLMAERSIDPLGDAFAPRASALPGSEDEQEFTKRGYLQTEIWPFFLLALTGMLAFPAANDLLMMFVALEVMSLPLYLLAGMARRRRLLSQEAALKYFVLGAFSSAFFLYGVAMLYGFSGSVSLVAIADTLTAKPSEATLVAVGMAMLLVGLLFKVAAVPFHQWTPDVYQGAPTPITGFMAATVKIAAFGALLRVLYVGLGGMRWDWEPILWIIAALTMLVGSIIAITQTDIKRMLAYSSIAQAGFILIGVLAVSPAGLASALFYLIAYAFTTIGAFAVISMVRDASGEATHLSKWAGLSKKSPLVAAIFSLFMLALAGIPLTSGFVGKFGVFTAAIASGATWLVIIGVVASVIAAFFYVRVIVIMYFSDPTPDTASVVVPSAFTTIALAAAATVTIVLGIFPQPVIELVNQAGVFIR
ncbi:MAG: NADH-quinone oxidoreductase subunit NuoN [Actinobacteria bacterium]|nr:NADH-quinone oxidoreductase subunit NuoN [Actinomycetota bacterium]